jgi:hypothetical protein
MEAVAADARRILDAASENWRLIFRGIRCQNERDSTEELSQAGPGNPWISFLTFEHRLSNSRMRRLYRYLAYPFCNYKVAVRQPVSKYPSHCFTPANLGRLNSPGYFGFCAAQRACLGDRPEFSRSSFDISLTLFDASYWDSTFPHFLSLTAREGKPFDAVELILLRCFSG